LVRFFLNKYINNSSTKSRFLFFVHNFLILLLFLPIFSCTDQGCIEADDFGDYEYQTLTIPANGLGASCSYDYSLDIDDPNQGSGLISYLTTGTATVTDTSGNQQTGITNKGCSGFDDASLKNLCINDAVQKCLSLYNASSGNVEPFWTPTGERDSSQNYGVTITPGAEITIKALGSVKLGDQTSFANAYVSAVDYLPTLKDEDLTKDLFFDVKSGQTVNVKFSGKWNNGSENIGGGSNSLGSGDEAIYNGARRAVIYLIPAPYGYKFNSSSSVTTEQEGTLGVPLLPDTKAWQCSYNISSGTSYNKATCSNKSYSTIGYNISSSEDDLISSTFPLSSSSKSSTLGQYGGMIRWTNDGIVSDAEFNPFSSATPAGISSGGMILGNASSEKSISNGTSNSYKVAFKAADSSCNIAIKVSIKDSSGNILNSYESRPYPFNITLSSTEWSPANYQNEIALEPNQNLVIDSITNTNSLGNNCGESIQIKFVKYHEVTINQSGLVSFTMLNGNGVVSNKCTLHGSIINPNGSHIDSGTIKADFYEYDPLLASNPLYNLEVLSRADGFDNNWSTAVFVRKGQKIRFSPESWNGTWVSESGITNCGVGMAMKINPRPALLCRGKKTTEVNNPLCNKDYSTGVLNGCLADDERCLDSSTQFYCPGNCQKPITCNSSTTEITKKTCQIGATPSTCTSYTSPATSTTCSSCAKIMLINAESSTTEEKYIDQCYDLENYTGKVSNIPIDSGFSDLGNTSIAKGAIELGNFNGQYGNFSSFIYTGSNDSDHNKNKIYQTTSPAIFSQAGRIRLLLLDGSNFLNLPDTYNNNSPKSTPALYSGLNGFNINFSGTLEYNSGEMLAVRLCDTTSGGVCNNLDPTAINPLIVEYDPASTSSSTIPLATSNYYFSSSGNLIRKTSPTGENECLDVSDGKAVTEAGSTFYCHNKIVDDKKKLRLTFKIIDPEGTNCNIPGTTNRGILLSNPAYSSSVAANQSATCGVDEIPSTVILSGQTQCKKEFYCANKYTNNSGEYVVTVKTKKIDDGNISQIIGNVVTPVIEIIDGSQDGTVPSQAERIYKLLISDSKYQTILSLCLGLMITFYAMATLSGVSEIKHSELVNRVIKIGLIYLFVGPEGWYWFNEIVVKFFKNGTDYLAFMMASSFDNSPEITTALQNNDYYDKSILFSSVDNVFNLFFSDAVQKKISGLLFADFFGFIYMWIIYLSFMLYVGAVCHSVLYYLTAQVFISILFIIAPLFFVLTLFGQTKDMFENWLKQLIGFSLQQIFLLVTLSFFNMMMYEVLKMSLGYKVCWDVVWSIKIIGTIDLLSFWTIPSVGSAANSQVGNISGQDSFPSLFSILFIWVVASLMNKFIGFMTDLAAGLGGSMKASELGAGIKSTVQDFYKANVSKHVDDIYKASVKTQIERIDEKFFDSGARASAARKEKQKKHAEDAQRKDFLRDTGIEALEEFKKNNASELVGLNAEEQRNKLEKVKNDSMIKLAKEKFGLSEDETKKLLSSKGSTYEGSNLLGYAYHSGRQLASGGGTFFKSINDESVSVNFSESEAKSAIKSKRMDSEQREKFVEAVEKGEIKVDRNLLGKAKGVIGKPITSAKDTGSSIANSVSEGYDSVRSAMGAGSYREAEKALEERGDIKKMSYGTSFARTDEEKKKIEDERQKMLTAKKDKELQNTINNPYAVKNIQKEAEAVEKGLGFAGRGIRAMKGLFSKEDEERVNKNQMQNLTNRKELLSQERKGLEAKEFEIPAEKGNIEKKQGAEIANEDLNKHIAALKEQKTYSGAAKSFIASLSDGSVFGKEKEKRNRVNRDLKDLKRIRKLREYDESAKTAHEKYSQDKENLKETKQLRSAAIGEKSLSNKAKDLASVVTFGKAFEERQKSKKEWKKSDEGKKYQESKDSIKNFEKNFNKDKENLSSVSKTQDKYDKYNNPDNKSKTPVANQKKESSAAKSIGSDMIMESQGNSEPNETTRQNLISNSNSQNLGSEENFNPMISNEVAANSSIVEKEENKPEKFSTIEKNTKEKVLNPLHGNEDE
jgi:type IV secretory pathway VirB6-like protein